MSMKTISTGLGTLGYDDKSGPDQPVAVLWPSLFADHTIWDRQVQVLRGAGWKTIALDLPGHGLSPGPGWNFTMDKCAEAGVQLLARLPAEAPVVILGTSWGGMIAPRIAARSPDRVKGLVLFNTTADSPDSATKMTARLLTFMLAVPLLDRMVDRMLLSMQLSAETRRDRPEVGEAMAARFRSWDRHALIRSVASVLVRRDAFFDKLAGVGAPTLVVSGAQDTILPTALSLRIANQMQKARHAEAAGAAHLVPLEQPEEADRLILEFLAALPKGGDASGGHP